MNIENINVEGIKDPETKRVVKQLIDEIFIMKRDFSRQLNHLTSQNVVSLDFNVTQVKNFDKLMK